MIGSDMFSHSLNEKPKQNGPVIYWMNRDQRVHYNRALLKAQQMALSYSEALCVVFLMTDEYPAISKRQKAFMLNGLKDLQLSLKELNIPFIIIKSNSVESLIEFFRVSQPSAVITDFSPLRQWRTWQSQVVEHLDCTCIEVDAHNIMPCRYVSPKQEFGAYTIRPKINKIRNDYMHPLPNVIKHPYSMTNELLSKLDFWNMVIQPSKSKTSGEKSALSVLSHFLKKGIHIYDQRNDPNQDAASGLSPYIHFGQISPLYIALTVEGGTSSGMIGNAIAADFLEQLIVRRELSDNFCFYNASYDSVIGFPEWAKKTLDIHRLDVRSWHYTIDELENGKTHDPLWNAAQWEMKNTGMMHGYMRMYWAKKILEWRQSPEEAMASAIYLNDLYSLDGMDPNGYTGIAWSIGGVHDRAWGERPVYGKIRYMSYDGCKRKFDVDQYIQRNQKG